MTVIYKHKQTLTGSFKQFDRDLVESKLNWLTM